MTGKSTLAGALLKLERLRQDRGQKEVCCGICVPSYLSKIEHGTVCPDEKILAELFARLGIVYEENPEVLEGLGKLIDEYFYCLQYHLDTGEVYEKLRRQERTLSYSRYAADWLLICAFGQTDGSYERAEAEPEQADESHGKAEAEPERMGESHRKAEAEKTVQEVLRQLTCLQEYMEPRQLAYYKILCAETEKKADEAVRLCREACETLNNSWAMLRLCTAYFRQGNYSEIHRMEQRVVAAAVEEGNTWQLADCFFVNGTAYACLGMEEMMMVYYERTIRLLQNTAWRKELSDVYYNIGATYIGLRKYDLAYEYLELADTDTIPEDYRFAILHKKAIVFLRTGRREGAEKFLAEMKKILVSKETASKTNWLIYEEAEMEAEEGFLNNPEYLKLLEKLIRAIKEELHFGYLYFYREVIVEAYRRQRKYKQALEFEQEISSGIIKKSF
ncbi:hypothetical protein BRYFOR_08058 [Marvinbryantia formatexigens DSM 14469]|uniref:Tetratricopeptide repeat protein n=1 Tax=Marvinbryantia formatexigens DSM 14469 TaxID=478749 RepID=C6LHE7_9FIRM|nr:hypothetical protein [Marvinbryantia formatexigens]EET59934.1 hypothetical protein BRYFOR_08058 [Marvinbryantia formatexigens DSM 14469]UWO25902.1 SPO22/ZIP4 family meiosis protein [Marvinbryantia formatexigens DSM 14469]SDF42279.1 hypothetical protein SAMN05660368_00720 [Marvinbryantia formatexigens]